ncbi:hypothetical protein NW768_007803 [Fusarium equiseti]|uniref:Xylanolytic transcriptional activator regulatory domain-containing protein n=1 Tax=Fusarium equiseti TaxID=61235 RepID=A0ABQ8R8P3_FUSEQ|nr:hypothetical protein NW768_007803 [Fusarium equiseti]
MAKAVSLIYRTKMQRTKFRGFLNRNDHSESARLFWITYILDRYTSMTAREPYLLQDNDIGITLEDMISDYRAGHIFPGGGQASFDILKFRVQLGIIQGRLYDSLYSVRADRQSPEDKEASRVQIDTMLDQWYSSLPYSVKTSNFSAMEPAVRQHCHLLHMIYYQTIFTVHDAALHNYNWIRCLRDFSRKWRADKQKAKKAYADTPVLMSNWPKLLETARAQVDILSSLDPPGNTWMAHMSHKGLRLTGIYATEGALTILAANNIAAFERATHDHLTKDEERIQKAWSNIKNLQNEYRGGQPGQYHHQEINIGSEELVREAGWCYDKYFNKRQRPNYWVDKMNANPASFGIY